MSSSRGIRKGSNEIDRYYDTAINAGGPIKADKLWWFGTYRTQFNAVAQPQFDFEQTFDTKLWNPVVKGTYQLNQNHKIIGYYQWGTKEQPNRLPFATYNYPDAGTTLAQKSSSWVYKAEWNGTLSDKLYVEARYGDFGYYFPLIANTDTQYLVPRHRTADPHRGRAPMATRPRPQAVDQRRHDVHRHDEGQSHAQVRGRNAA